jgi:hypothetical protein
MGRSRTRILRAIDCNTFGREVVPNMVHFGRPSTLGHGLLPERRRQSGRKARKGSTFGLQSPLCSGLRGSCLRPFLLQ